MKLILNGTDSTSELAKLPGQRQHNRSTFENRKKTETGNKVFETAQLKIDNWEFQFYSDHKIIERWFSNLNISVQQTHLNWYLISNTKYSVVITFLNLVLNSWCNSHYYGSDSYRFTHVLWSKYTVMNGTFVKTKMVNNLFLQLSNEKCSILHCAQCWLKQFLMWSLPGSFCKPQQNSHNTWQCCMKVLTYLTVMTSVFLQDTIWPFRQPAG